MAVEFGAGQQSQLRQHLGRHLLRLVDDQDGTDERAVDVGLPALAQYLEAVPAVVRAELDAEQRPHLAVLFRLQDHSASGSRNADFWGVSEVTCRNN